jgi:Transposase DDE domain
VRQLLADKISGNQVGLWLLAPEHLRLGTWDLWLRWTGQSAERVEPRLALHLVQEAALCLCSFRHGRTLSQKGFELANGLPFVPTDQAVHDLLDAHTVEQAQHLQIALGKLRRASQHFTGRVLAMDPHRMTSHSKRLMRRHRFSATEKPAKMGQTFFLLDTETGQPVCFTLASSAPSVVQASPDLLRMAAEVLSLPSTPEAKPLVLADKEHFSQELFTTVRQLGCFDLLCPVPAFPNCLKRWEKIPADDFTPQWPGYATTTQPYRFQDDPAGLCYELVQRNGGTKKDFHFQGFVSTVARPEMPTLTRDYPQRWQVEEFFKFNQALGWHRTGTLNLNVRYGQMTMALLAQAALHPLRRRLGQPMIQWDAEHLAQHVFQGLEGDIRVHKDTAVVTYYNAPNADLLRAHYENLPEKLRREGVDPRVPWLYNFKLDFRFK